MHENALLLFRDRVLPQLPPGARVLEIGPDWSPSTLQGLAGDRVAEWDTADLESGPPTGRLTYAMTDPNVLPVADGRYDVVVSSSVIEHVREPWVWFPEVARVVRPGGLVVTIGPVSWPEHKDDNVPYDCWRILPDGMRVLAERAGLEIVVLEHTSLEPAARHRWYPGETHRFLRPARPAVVERASGVLDRLLRRPRSAAVDCLTIARKPG